ncbi:MAG TPA: outer membrane beta-barrel protein [Stellaceae bacterium]|nr:outer membrane beta-barrel protein [Stellaceae bacterium]
MLKRITGLAAIAAVFSVGAAHAADMAPVYKAAPPAPIFSWTGFYIGANVGFGSATASADVGAFHASQDLTGILGGGQIGYNWQAGAWVFGIEGDFQGTDEHKKVSGAVGNLAVSVDNSVPWFATIRGRIGYAFAPTWMIYATGGGVWQDFKSTITVNGLSATLEDTHGGWTLGAGLEAAINRNWSWKVEYLHLDTGSINGGVVNGVSTSARLTNDLGRIGINYHF